MFNPRNKKPYVRVLELQAVISEDYGKLVKELNDYLWKGNNLEHLENAEKALQQLNSPLKELEGLLEITKLKKGF